MGLLDVGDLPFALLGQDRNGRGPASRSDPAIIDA